MPIPSRWWRAALVAGAFLIATQASADSTVTACGADNTAGGVNLRDGVAAGGRITFQCGAAPAVIQITAPLNVGAPTQIDGEGRITLQGAAAGALFEATSRLELDNLQVRNDAPGADGIVRGSTADLVLRGVTTSNTPSAYVARTVTAQDSTFEANGSAAGAFGAIINAELVQLTKATFNKNFDHPIAGGQAATGRAPLSRQITIDSSTFTANSGSILALDAIVIIRGSKFTGNGTAPAGTPGSWSCCAGVLTAVNSKVSFYDNELVGNGSTGAGGAIYAIGSDVRIVRTLLRSNAASVGGAIFSWAHPVTNNIWSTPGAANLTPGLTLTQARFHQNKAQFGGGAIAWAGPLTGNAAIFANNQAHTGGAIAHWSAIALPGDFQLAFSELTNQTAAATESLDLSKGIFSENQARVAGAAIAGGTARLVLGNALVIRNSFAPANSAGAAIEGANVDLASSTIADNPSGGMKVPPAGQRARIVNSLVLRNGPFGCSVPAGKQDAAIASWQFPASDCLGVAVRDPQLQKNYKPTVGSAVADAGEMSLCLTEPLVGGLDLASTVRGKRGTCAVGAYEPDPRIDTVSGWSSEDNHWIRWILLFLFLLFLLLGFLIAFFWMRRRRRRRRTYEGTPA